MSGLVYLGFDAVCDVTALVIYTRSLLVMLRASWIPMWPFVAKYMFFDQYLLLVSKAIRSIYEEYDSFSLDLAERAVAEWIILGYRWLS